MRSTTSSPTRARPARAAPPSATASRAGSRTPRPAPSRSSWCGSSIGWPRPCGHDRGRPHGPLQRPAPLRYGADRHGHGADPVRRPLWMAEQELKNIVDRTANGRAKACEDGFSGGAVPYGSEPDGDGGLRAVPHEALIIRRLFRTCAGPAAGAPMPAESWPASVAARQTHPSADPLHLERRGAMRGPHARPGRAASRWPPTPGAPGAQERRGWGKTAGLP